MADAQFMAELFIVVIYDRMVGFDQDLIDEIYAAYDDVGADELNFDEDAFRSTCSLARETLVKMEEHNRCISEYASTAASMYILWSYLVTNRNQLQSETELAERYASFMQAVTQLASSARALNGKDDDGATIVSQSADVQEYYINNQSATTELPQREGRLAALTRALSSEDR